MAVFESSRLIEVTIRKANKSAFANDHVIPDIPTYRNASKKTMSRTSKGGASSQNLAQSRFAILAEDDDGADEEADDVDSGFNFPPRDLDEEDEIARAIALVAEFERREKQGGAGGAAASSRQRASNAQRLQTSVGNNKAGTANASNSTHSASQPSKSKLKQQRKKEQQKAEQDLDAHIVQVLEILPNADPQAVQTALLDNDMDIAAAIDTLTLNAFGSSPSWERNAKKKTDQALDDQGWPILDHEFLNMTRQEAKGELKNNHSDDLEDDGLRRAVEESRKTGLSVVERAKAAVEALAELESPLEVFIPEEDIKEDDGKSVDDFGSETGSVPSTDTEDAEWEAQLLDASHYEHEEEEGSALEFLVDMFPEVPRSLFQELSAKHNGVGGPELFDFLVALQEQAVQTRGKQVSMAEVVEAGCCGNECRSKKGGEKGCLLHGTEGLMRKLQKKERDQTAILARLQRAEAELFAEKGAVLPGQSAWDKGRPAAPSAASVAKPRAGPEAGFYPRAGKNRIFLVPDGRATEASRNRDVSPSSSRVIPTPARALAVDPSEWQDYRSKGNDAYLRARDFYRQASLSYSKKDLTGFGSAQYYSDLAREARDEAQKWHDKAAAALVARTEGTNVLDLHYMFQKEAIAAVEERLTRYYAGWTYLRARQGMRQFKIITGKGLHSDNRRARIYPAVCNFLRKNGWKFQARTGDIIVFGPGN